MGPWYRAVLSRDGDLTAFLSWEFISFREDPQVGPFSVSVSSWASRSETMNSASRPAHSANYVTTSLGASHLS